MREFGWTCDEADKAEKERMPELRIYLKIFEFEADAQDKAVMRASQ